MMRQRLILVAAVSFGLVGCTVRPGSLVPLSAISGTEGSAAQDSVAGGGAQGIVNEYGTLSLTIRWPERPEGYQTALIPTSTNALTVKVSSGSTVVAETTVNRVSNETTVTTNLSLKADNNLSVEVKAYRETAPIPVGASPIAQGTANVNIARSQKTNAKISLTPLIVPTITALSRNAGVPGDEVTITGTNFGSGSIPINVYFNGYVTVGATRSSETSVTVKVPPGTPTGQVVVKADGVDSESNVVFWVPKTITLSTDYDSWDHSERDKQQIVLLGKTKQLSATTEWATKLNEVATQYGMPPNPTWSSSDTTVGTVDSDGLFTAGNSYVPAGTNLRASHGSMSSSALKMLPEAVTFSLGLPPAPRTLGGKGKHFLKYSGINTFSDGATNSFVTYSAASASIDWLTGRAVATDFGSNGTITVSAESQVDPSQTTTTDITLSNYTVSTFAGNTNVGTDNGAAATATFGRPQGMAFDQAGNMYVADHDNGLIRRISGGMVSTVAVSGISNMRPWGVAYYRDPVGSTDWLYVTDDSNHNVYRIELLSGGTAGSGTLLAGASTSGYLDGAGAAAKFFEPSGIAVDADRNVYVVDSRNFCIRKIDSSGMVSTLAGSPFGQYVNSFHRDGTGSDPNTGAKFMGPKALAMDADGNLFVPQVNDGRIRRVTPSGVVTTLSLSESFWNPMGIAVDPTGNLFISEESRNKIYKVSPEGDVISIAGSSGGSSWIPSLKGGIGNNADFRAPNAIVRDSSGNLYVSEYTNNAIRKLE